MCTNVSINWYLLGIHWECSSYETNFNPRMWNATSSRVFEENTPYTKMRKWQKTTFWRFLFRCMKHHFRKDLFCWITVIHWRPRSPFWGHDWVDHQYLTFFKELCGLLEILRNICVQLFWYKMLHSIQYVQFCSFRRDEFYFQLQAKF